MEATTEPPGAGIVLAGGHSRRFGPTDKALASLDGRSMLRLVADRLACVTGRVVVNCRPDQRDQFAAALDGAPYGVEFAVDPTDRVDGGPVAGLLTALDAVETPTVAVVPCDVPRLPPSLLRVLFVHAVGREGAVPDDGTRRHPLPAVYRVPNARVACESVGPGGSLCAVVERLDPVVVPPSTIGVHASAGELDGVDTRQDLERVARGTSAAD